MVNWLQRKLHFDERFGKMIFDTSLKLIGKF
jgi:hypothetical protein